MTFLQFIALSSIGAIIFMLLVICLRGVCYIPQDKIGIVEKFWSTRGSLCEGRIIALNREAGFQADILRGGIHFGYYPWQYRIHRQPLVTVGEGRLAYVYARDGKPLLATQTLGRVVECNSFQDARAFLETGGERGRQRAILREGVFAINTALFVVITEDTVYSGPVLEAEPKKYSGWQEDLLRIDGFSPVVIGPAARGNSPPPPPGSIFVGPDPNSDQIGVVTVHDGPTIPSGEIIAPEVGGADSNGHNYFQDPEAFLRLGGRRGKQLQVLTDGTFFINRWFATVDKPPKTVIPIGYVGVIVSYYGKAGQDLTGKSFRYGEQVDPGERGVWKSALPPGKYALNPYALKVELVPTLNFVLRWISGQSEAHQYDTDLSSIALITADGYEPLLPLSLVVHIDYEKASSVIQRFGDVKSLVSQTLDPILTAYFRDVAQSSSMLDLLTKREELQQRATLELGRRFANYDINCVAVLIGRPESLGVAGSADPIELLFDQLRARRLAAEQKETYVKQQETARQLRELNEATAAAAKQAELTQTKIEIEVAANRGSAQLAEVEGLAKRDIARAEGESRASELLGRGEAARVSQVGEAEANVNRLKVEAYRDPRLFALNLLGEQLSKSTQPLVPERVLLFGQAQENGSASPRIEASGLLSALLGLLASEKSGLNVLTPNDSAQNRATE
jgi:uncharacterized membrane protein YqiK